jgi:hypothetical protein
LVAANDSHGAGVERITGELEAIGSNQWQGHFIERVCLHLSAWLEQRGLDRDPDRRRIRIGKKIHLLPLHK